MGCNDVRKDGFVNIDVRQTEACDLVAKAWEMPFAKQTCSSIYSRHVLEHLTRHDAVCALKHWFDLLECNGRLNVIVPDIEFHAKQLLGLVCCPLIQDQQEHAFAGFYGWCESTRGGHQEDSHRWAYTENTLVALCSTIGFENISRVQSGVDSEPWHLNVIARKPS